MDARPPQHARLRAVAWATLALLLAVPARPRAAEQPAAAQRWFNRGQAYLQRGTIEGRRMASECFQHAALLAPSHVPYRLALGDLCLRQGFLGAARRQYEAAAAADSGAAAAYFGLGEVWRRDYLKYLEPSSLERAIRGYATCARLDPGHAPAWVNLVPLHIERGDARTARAAAEHAYLADSGSADALLALALTAYRAGEVEWSERAFALAIGELDPEARFYFGDISPVASERDTVALRRLPTPAARAAFVERFWKSLDPDLGTEVNEARTEYWARAAQAYFLYYDRRRKQWDERGEVYVRYGPPEHAVYEPVVKPHMEGIRGLRLFPYNTLVWSYPSLGLTVAMTDRTLNGYYSLPPSLYFDMDPRPSPDSLARLQARWLASSDGRGLFPRLPPRARELPLAAGLARFRAGDGGRGHVVIAVESPGRPADSLWCEGVVLDSALNEVQRSRRLLGASACDPVGVRSSEFTFDLEPGRYLLGLSLRDGSGGRAAWRSPLTVFAPPGQLEMSDLELTCGAPPVPGDPQFRVSPNPGARVAADQPVGVYFEAYGLVPGPDGLARYTIEYTVRSGERDERPWISRVLSRRPSIPALSAMRSDQQRGELRRQFVSIPVQALPPGRYRLEIRLKDEVAQSETRREVRFQRL
jgi:GWxTD domain-containing protein